MGQNPSRCSPFRATLFAGTAPANFFREGAKKMDLPLGAPAASLSSQINLLFPQEALNFFLNLLRSVAKGAAVSYTRALHYEQLYIISKIKY